MSAGMAYSCREKTFLFLATMMTSGTTMPIKNMSPPTTNERTVGGE